MSASRDYSFSKVETTVLSPDHFTRSEAGETATIFTYDLELGPGLATVIPLPTSVVLLASHDANRTYVVSVRGYTVEQFLGVALAYANGSFDEAQRLIVELQGDYEQ